MPSNNASCRSGCRLMMSSEGDDEDFHICGRCKAVFYTIESYLDHKQSKSCQQSSKRANKDDLDAHDLKPPAKKRGRPPSRFENLPEHIKQLAPKSPLCKEHTCPKCEYKVDDWVEFDRHMRKHHNLTQYWCKKCNTPFCDRYKMRRHINSCRSETSTVGDTSASSFVPFNTRSRRFYKTEDEDFIGNIPQLPDSVPSIGCDFSCRECSTNCQDHKDILQHLKEVHLGIFPAVCKFCGQWFRQRQHLWRHINSSLHDDLPDAFLLEVKTEIQNLKCFWPDAKIDSEKTRKHAQKPVSCSECGKVCSTKAYLEKHIHRNHNAPPVIKDSGFKCLVCYKAFSASVSLKRHMTMVHSEPCATPNGNQCKVCLKKLKQNKQTLDHMKQMHTASLQGPIEDLITLGDSTFSAVDLPLNCFVCSTYVSTHEALVEHLQCHRMWAPHAQKGSLPVGLLDTDPYPVGVSQGVVQERTKNRYVEAANQSEEHAKLGEDSLIDHDTLTDLIDEINEANKMLTGNCLNISAAMETVSQDEEVELRVMNDEHLLCAYCLGSFPSLKALYDHKVSQHQLVLVFQCCQLDCQARFQTTEEYWSHHQSVHSQVAFICQTCNYHTESSGSLLSHKLIKHKDVIKDELLCQFCNKKFDSRQEIEDHVKSNASHFMCSVCCRIVKTKAELSSHEATHADSNSLLCEQCGSTFRSKLILQRHRLTHNAERKFKCEICEMSFHKLEYLKRHCSSKHSEVKPFTCNFPECGKSFKRKDKLMDHMKVHSNAKNYSCNICGRKYRNRDGLRYHLKSHARGEGIDCPICGISFPQQCQLSQHMTEVHLVCIKSSHVYHCAFCSTSYSRPETVKRHMEKEHNVKAVWHHRCLVCQKGFSGPKALDKHVAAKHPQEHTVAASGGIKAEQFVSQPEWSLMPDINLAEQNTDSLTPDVKNAFISHERIIHEVTDKGDRKALMSSMGKQHLIAFSTETPLSPLQPRLPPPPPASNFHLIDSVDIFQAPPLNLSTVETTILSPPKPQHRPLQPKPELLPPSIQVQSQSSVTISIGSTPLQTQSSGSSRVLI
ncbi:hypothetical protein CAPTEDRAFT_227344, partial [Capitella teleta]